MTEKWTPTVASDELLENVSLQSWIFQALGAASTCWSEPPAGVFDSDRVKAIGEGLHAHVQDVIDGVIAGTLKASGEGRTTHCCANCYRQFPNAEETRAHVLLCHR